MRTITLLLFIALTQFFCFSQKFDEMTYSQLSPLLSKNSDTTYVVNFWATWCKPCVDELPHFIKASEELKKEKVKFIFVSLDFPSQKESRLLPFLEKKKIRERVILLNDPDSNSWIDKVDKQWSGAIPATLIYKKQKRVFKESSISYEELIRTIKTIQL